MTISENSAGGGRCFVSAVERTADSDPAVLPICAAKQNYGTLQVRAVTARGALPVEGARIYISEDDPENGKTGVIFSGRTNSAGLSEKISLPAPPPENSEVPGGDDVCTKYNVEVIADGFYPVYSLDVPVFPGILSIQSVELVPTPREAEA